MDKPFVVVSGLPGSGKSTLAQHLAPALSLPILDKDIILERLFEMKGVGDVGWHRVLSRESDLLFQAEAAASDGAVLVSHWHLPGMPVSSGTPTKWLSKVSSKVVNVHCDCPVDVAAERYARRTRHPGHLDSEKPYAEILGSIHELAKLGRPNIAACIAVDTSHPVKLDAVLREVVTALSRCGSGA